MVVGEGALVVGGVARVVELVRGRDVVTVCSPEAGDEAGEDAASAAMGGAGATVVLGPKIVSGG